MSTTIFSFENAQVRALGTPDSPLFVALDVATALGYANPKAAPAKHVDADDLIKVEITDSLGRTQTANAVNESGLYALIFGSKLDTAKRFKRWVTSEVLPAIRRTVRNRPVRADHDYRAVRDPQGHQVTSKEQLCSLPDGLQRSLRLLQDRELQRPKTRSDESCTRAHRNLHT